MKKAAALILNRNLPPLADELGDWIIKHHSRAVDLHVLENGSDPGNYSRYANIFIENSLGPSGGINEGLRQLFARGYEYVWVNYNDARYEQPGFLEMALNNMEADPAVALTFPYWENNTWLYGKRGSSELVTFCAILGFVVRRAALTSIAAHPHFRFEPLWDSSNFSNHDNILATLLALYERKLCAVTDRRFTVTEITEPADTASVIARGFSAAEWKHRQGITDVEAWYRSAFPELTGNYKAKRAIIIRRIGALIRENRLGIVPTRYPWFTRLYS